MNLAAFMWSAKAKLLRSAGLAGAPALERQSNGGAVATQKLRFCTPHDLHMIYSIIN